MKRMVLGKCPLTLPTRPMGVRGPAKYLAEARTALQAVNGTSLYAPIAQTPPRTTHTRLNSTGPATVSGASNRAHQSRPAFTKPPHAALHAAHTHERGSVDAPVVPMTLETAGSAKGARLRECDLVRRPAPKRFRSVPPPRSSSHRYSCCASKSRMHSATLSQPDDTAETRSCVNIPVNHNHHRRSPPTASPGDARSPPPQDAARARGRDQSWCAETHGPDICTHSQVDCTTETRRHSLSTTSTAATRLDLPDEVLVTVLRFVRCAASLWRLRAVSRRWRRVIDGHDIVWRSASFRGAQFARPVRLSLVSGCKSRRALTLGARRGRAIVTKAAAAGNEWACFLAATLFHAHPLHALTVAQPVASVLVRSARRFETRESPPWRGDGVPGAWVAVHAARRVAPGLSPAQIAVLPRGAIVGLVHVRSATACGSEVAPLWAWHIDRNIALRKPLRCAGYVGVWTLSTHLTEFCVRALHMQ